MNVKKYYKKKHNLKTIEAQDNRILHAKKIQRKINMLHCPKYPLITFLLFQQK